MMYKYISVYNVHADCDSFWNTNMCMGVKRPCSPPSMRAMPVSTSIWCTWIIPLGATPRYSAIVTREWLNFAFNLKICRLVESLCHHGVRDPSALTARSLLLSNVNPTFFPASSATFHDRRFGRPLPIIISSPMATCASFFSS